MKSDAQLHRRSLLRLGLDALLAAGTLLLLGAGMLRSAYPRLFPGGQQKIKVGEPRDFPTGTVTYFDEGRFFLLSDERGLWAISAVCTHLGCVVNQSSDGFLCACHGSRFDAMGMVTHGPAPKGLPWLAIQPQPNGQLVVDAIQEVPAGTKLERTA